MSRVICIRNIIVIIHGYVLTLTLTFRWTPFFLINILEVIIFYQIHFNYQLQLSFEAASLPSRLSFDRQNPFKGALLPADDRSLQAISKPIHL